MTALAASFTLRLRFLSDWHIGVGEGRLAAVDAVVRRDATGLPFVPAKTLIGVWRDACETVASALDASSAGEWAAWVDWIFGSQPANQRDRVAGNLGPPVPAALTLAPARFPENLRQVVASRPALREAAVILRPGVKLNPDSGTAEDTFLRLEERARRGALLESPVSLRVDGPVVPEPAELLLRAGARFLESVGGKRNRGTGRVVVLLPGVVDPAEDARSDQRAPQDPRLTELLAFPGLLDHPGTPPPAPPPLPASLPAGRVAEGDRRTVRVVLEALTPVVAQEAVLGNVITSRSFIPGTMLLGSIIGCVEREGGLGIGDLRVGDAVPGMHVVNPDGGDGSVVPGYVEPLVWWRADKGTGNQVTNVALGKSEPQSKPGRGRIARLPDGSWQGVSNGLSVSTHAVVDDDERRPTSSGGGVFSYVGIAAGTLLVTDVVLPADARLVLAEGVQLRAGRSSKDDFGLLRVQRVEEIAAPATRQPTAAATEGAPTLTIWCVSDVLLRDERLAPDPSPSGLVSALRKGGIVGELAGQQRDSSTAEVDWSPTPTAASVSRREGYARRWNRPRSSQIALAAGTVVTISVNAPVDDAVLRRIELEGIGERTAEGFGRIQFDPPELAQKHPRVRPASEQRLWVHTATAVTDLDASPHPLEVAAWRTAIRRCSARLAMKPEQVLPNVFQGKQISRAQLGALRAQLERLALPDGEPLVRQWLTATKEVTRRKETWGGTLQDVEALLVGEPDLVWQKLGLAGDTPELVLHSGRENAVRQALRQEALQTLLGATLRVLRSSTVDRPAKTEVEAQ